MPLLPERPLYLQTIPDSTPERLRIVSTPIGRAGYQVLCAKGGAERCTASLGGSPGWPRDPAGSNGLAGRPAADDPRRDAARAQRP